MNLRVQLEQSIIFLNCSSGNPHLEKQLHVSTDINFDHCLVVFAKGESFIKK